MNHDKDLMVLFWAPRWDGFIVFRWEGLIPRRLWNGALRCWLSGTKASLGTHDIGGQHCIWIYDFDTSIIHSRISTNDMCIADKPLVIPCEADTMKGSSFFLTCTASHHTLRSLVVSLVKRSCSDLGSLGVFEIANMLF